MWRRVDLVWTLVSEERIASIFGVEKSASEEPVWVGNQQAGFHSGDYEKFRLLGCGAV
jgi:hypothetical protein